MLSKSADITAEDQTYAFEQAQTDLWNTAANDTTLLNQAQETNRKPYEVNMVVSIPSIGKRYTFSNGVLQSSQLTDCISIE